jgi:WXG100 family type VII secretion target
MISMAPTNEITVNLDALDRLVDGLEAFNTQVGAQLSALEQRMSSLHGQWQGDGAEAHARAQAEWAHGAQLMSEGVTRLHAASAAAHSAFHATVQANRALFS